MATLDWDVETDSAPGLDEIRPEARKLMNLSVDTDRFDSAYESVGDNCLSQDFQKCSLHSSEDQSPQPALVGRPEEVVERLQPTQSEEETSKSCQEDTEDDCIEPDEDPNEELRENLAREAFCQDQDGDTTLHMGVIHSRPDVVDRMLELAPSPDHLDIRNHLQQTPLALATVTDQPEVARQLLVHGASLDIPDRNGRTPLHHACLRGNGSLVQALTTPVSSTEVKHRHLGQLQRIPQNLEQRDYEGFTCLHLAASERHYDIVQYLVSIGADVNSQDGKSGRTALHHAVERNDIQMVKALLFGCGAQVDTQMYNSCTPLHLAVGRRHQEITSFLIQAGANPNLSNTEEDTPQDLAAGDDDIASMLYDDIRIGGQPVHLDM
ncbi:NF-kappa-B inhibitor epsilon-like isoform X2 [Branchiostoma floridae]|uniref:NF-kappa-B inhibitor epsilon-like isoform X2 n=1 Tax=Branchiostoma floridae TaxID=7739 RepID=A0A9J7KT21_BRAFL|nr:NF-kappa-B inhibitor epsilon-like isoform X2 [Branchiostoma floridae]